MVFMRDVDTIIPAYLYGLDKGYRIYCEGEIVNMAKIVDHKYTDNEAFIECFNVVPDYQ